MFHFNPAGPHTLLFRAPASANTSGTRLFVRTRRRFRERLGWNRDTGDEILPRLDEVEPLPDLSPLEEYPTRHGFIPMDLPTAVSEGCFEDLVRES